MNKDRIVNGRLNNSILFSGTQNFTQAETMNDNERKKMSMTMSLAQEQQTQNEDTIVQGVDNLGKMRFIDNSEKFKTVLLNGYLQKRQSVQDVTKKDEIKQPDIGKCLKSRQNSNDHFLDYIPVYEKKVFAPFKQERDHLGRLIDSVSNQ